MIIILYCLNQSKRLSLNGIRVLVLSEDKWLHVSRLQWLSLAGEKKREEKKRNIQKSDDFFNNPIEHNIPWFFPFDI